MIRGRGSSLSADVAAIAAAIAGNGLDVQAPNTLFVQPSEIAGLGLESDLQGPPKLRTKAELRTWQYDWDKVPDAAGTTATSERPFARNVHGVTLALAAAVFAVASTHAGNDTNNFVIILRKRDAAGALIATIVTYTNNVASGGYLTAFATKDMGALASATLQDGEWLTIEITKNGTGATLAAICVQVKFTLPG